MQECSPKLDQHYGNVLDNFVGNIIEKKFLADKPVMKVLKAHQWAKELIHYSGNLKPRW